MYKIIATAAVLFSVGCVQMPAATCSVPYMGDFIAHFASIDCEKAVKDVQAMHDVLVTQTGKISEEEFRTVAAKTVVQVMPQDYWEDSFVETQGDAYPYPNGWVLVRVDCHGGSLLHEMLHSIEINRGRSIPSFFHTHWDVWGWWDLSINFMNDVYSNNTAMDDGESVWFSPQGCNLNPADAGN